MDNETIKKYAGFVMVAMVLILVVSGYDYDTAKNILTDEDVIAYVISIISAIVWGTAHAHTSLNKDKKE